jgi:hypothetical protein
VGDDRRIDARGLIIAPRLVPDNCQWRAGTGGRIG